MLMDEQQSCMTSWPWKMTVHNYVMFLEMSLSYGHAFFVTWLAGLSSSMYTCQCNGRLYTRLEMSEIKQQLTGAENWRLHHKSLYNISLDLKFDISWTTVIPIWYQGYNLSVRDLKKSVHWYWLVRNGEMYYWKMMALVGLSVIL